MIDSKKVSRKIVEEYQKSMVKMEQPLLPQELNLLEQVLLENLAEFDKGETTTLHELKEIAEKYDCSSNTTTRLLNALDRFQYSQGERSDIIKAHNALALYKKGERGWLRHYGKKTKKLLEFYLLEKGLIKP